MNRNRKRLYIKALCGDIAIRILCTAICLCFLGFFVVPIAYAPFSSVGYPGVWSFDVYVLLPNNKLVLNGLKNSVFLACIGTTYPLLLKISVAYVLGEKRHDMNGDGKLNEIPFIGYNGVDGLNNFLDSFLLENSSGNAYGSYHDHEGQLVFTYVQEDYKGALAYGQSLYQQGFISHNRFTISNKDRYVFTGGSRRTVRVEGVVGITVAWIVQLSAEADVTTYANDLSSSPPEGPEGGHTIITEGETLVSLRNAITAQYKKPIIAMRGMDAGYSEAIRKYAVYGGLENPEWEYVEGDNINGHEKIVVSKNEIPENAIWNGQGIVYRVTEENYLNMDASKMNTSDALCNYWANVIYRPFMVQNPWSAIVWPDELMEEAAQYSELSSLIQDTVTSYLYRCMPGP